MSNVIGINPECLQYSKQDFQVSVAVYKARHLQVLNADTFVLVSLAGKYKRTKMAYRTDCPYFNDYFSFELRTTKQELLKKSVLFQLYRAATCTTMGSCVGRFSIDLRTIWDQINHGFIRKWASFDPVENPSTGGFHQRFLMIDVFIVPSYETPSPVIFNNTDFDVIESNLLMPYENCSTARRVQYSCSIRSGHFTRGAKYVIQISYAGQKARTKSSPFDKTVNWNEKLSFNGTFPSVNQNFLIDLIMVDCCCCSKVATKNINFASISKRISGIDQLPTFGPTWIYFYHGPQETYFAGKLLISISTEVVSVQSVTYRKPQTTSILDPFVASNYWEEKTFVAKISITSLQLFHNIQTPRVLLYLTWGEICSESVNLPMMDRFEYGYAAHNQSMRSGCPQLTIAIRAPDYMHKYFLTATVANVYNNVKNVIETLNFYEQQRLLNDKAMKQYLNNCMIALETTFGKAIQTVSSSSYKKHTKWDQMTKDYVLDYLVVNQTRICHLQQEVQENEHSNNIHATIKCLSDELNAIQADLQNLSHDEQNRLPDILLHFSRPTRGSPDAVYRFNTIDYLSATSTLGVTSLLGGKRCTILPRSLNCRHCCPDQCGCIHAKLDYVMVIEPEPNGVFSSAQVYAEANHTEHAVNLQRTDFQIGPLQVDCKIHVHQGRFFSTHDENQLSNAKLTVLFENYETTFSPITNTLSPIWNETAEMHNVPFATVIDELNPRAAQKCTLILVLHSNSTHKALRALGFLESSVTWSQVANLQTEEDELNVHRFNTVLRWVPMYNNGVRVAEILMSSNILEVQTTERSQTGVGVECCLVQSLPQEIAPQLCGFTMRVCFEGLRQIYRKPCATLKKMRVLVTVGNGTVTSGYSGIIHGHSVNFPGGCGTTSLNLPLETQYWPSVIIKLVDYSDTKRPTVISLAIVTNPECFLETTQPPVRMDAIEQPAIIDVSPISTDDPDRAGTSWATTLPNIATLIASKVNAYKPTHTTTKSTRKLRRRTSTNTQTWWTKFYSSLQDGALHNHALTVYDRELESVTKFSGFKDWSGKYPLYKVKRTNDSLLQNDLFGFVKCKISIVPEDAVPLTASVSFKPSSSVTSHAVGVVVAVYVVQALNLASRDVSSESDAYIVLTYGKRCVRDRAYYIPNQSSPVFGRRFELQGEFPRDQMLQLSIYDRDFASPDDLIGSTFIDIEDRFRSKHRPGFGLPKVYTTQGYNQWRHLLKPSQMLQRLLEDHRLPFAPRIEGSKIMVGSAEFEADEIDAHESQSEQLCLLALNNFEHIAEGCSLTPEHVETRSLYHPKRGGIEQGKVQLWVEIYEPDLPHPRPLDITPQPPRPYELRLIVWNTADVVLNERNIFGTEMSDIYVKCWLQEFTEAQSTDVHYRSLTGEGNFNWRMIFPFHYSPADATMVIRRKKAFYERFDTEIKYPPVLTVQIWDNDSFSADDFLGTLELNLSRLPSPASSADRCTLHGGFGAKNQRFINLFEEHRVRGWFPVHGRNTNRKDESSERTYDIVLTGKIELELEVLSQGAAGQSPVGRGRNPPHHLPEPLRPEVSFNWLHQPRKTLKKLLWPRVRKSVVYFGAVVVGCLLIYGIVVNAPGLFLRRSSTVVLSGASSSVGN